MTSQIEQNYLCSKFGAKTIDTLSIDCTLALVYNHILQKIYILLNTKDSDLSRKNVTKCQHFLHTSQARKKQEVAQEM